MRETVFIQQNEEKWRDFEQALATSNPDPDKLNDLYIQVTDDLSHARTFYPNRSVRVYLNSLAQQFFIFIYKNKSSRRSRFLAFWKDDLPHLLYEARRDLMLSFFVFSLAIAIGILSCAADPDFVSVILGDAYVEMTKENIRSGDPMAVYKQRGEFNMFLGITLNNLQVAFLTFLFGIFYEVGAIGFLLFNGVMLGAFQYFFIQQGLFRESFLAVWLHGAFELSSIVIAGAAGLTLGRGLVFPGTLPRLRSFQLAARRGFGIMIGIVPLLIVAGFTESYFTRHTDAPDWLRGSYIAFCLAFVLFYFVLYPAWKAKKGHFAKTEGQRIAPDVSRPIDLSLIKTTGDIFTDAFQVYRKYFKPIVWAAFGGAALYCIGAFFLSGEPAGSLFNFSAGWFASISNLGQFFHHPDSPWLFLLHALASSIVLWAVSRMMERLSSTPSRALPRTTLGFLFLKIYAVNALYLFILIYLGWSSVLLLMVATPFVLLWLQVMWAENKGILGGFLRTARLSRLVYGQMCGLFFAVLLCGVLFYMALDTGIAWLLLDFLSMNFFFTPDAAAVFSAALMAFLSVFMQLLITGMWMVGGVLQYYSNLELHEARSLTPKIAMLGMQRKIKGLERE
jgi:uncharacterized membrane protein SpoIIM required for sporulation